MAVPGMTSGWFGDTEGPLRQSDVPWGKLDDLWSQSDASVAAAPWSDSPVQAERFVGRSQWDGVNTRRSDHPRDSDAPIFNEVMNGRVR